MSLANPWFVLLLLPLGAVGLTAWRGWWQSRRLLYPTLAIVRLAPTTWRIRFSRFPLLLELLAGGLIVLALMRPRQGVVGQEMQREGIDLVLALDVSVSMDSRDLEQGDSAKTRLQVAIQAALQFTRRRLHDRLGLIVFAADPLTYCPLTTDHVLLSAALERLGQAANLQERGFGADGTALGAALALATAALSPSPAKSKVVILLTDGLNTDFSLPPETAAELAHTMGVRVYPIAAASRLVSEENLLELDEELLRHLAQQTGGRYFRAADAHHLAEAFAQIDRLETSPYPQTFYRYREYAPLCMALALSLAVLALLLEQTVFRRVR